MIVDKEEDILKKVKLYLESEDIEVITAENSRQALKLMEKETFDLILVGTQMPCTNSSALFSLNPKVRGEMGGRDDFLEKPFDKEQLISFVKEKIGV
jgi:DNA-binding response OmpR family regulator